MKLCSFLIKGFTREHFPFAGAIISSVDAKPEMEEIVKCHMNNFKPGKGIDCFELDYRLADHLKKIDTTDIFALGITIKVSNIEGPTGGIIGGLSQQISSADGISEDLGNGLSVAAYPGGPGLVVQTTPKKAQEILESVNPGEEGLAPLMILKDKVIENNINVGIMLTDGTGVKLPGAVLCINGRLVNYYQLPGE